MKYEFNPKDVCSKKMIFDINNDSKTINNLEVIGGCPGNLSGISSLIKGMKIDDVIEKLANIKCTKQLSSCPAQIAKALEEYKKNL